MLYPAISGLLQDGISRYSLVIAMAKRARVLSERAEEDHEQLPEKPVKMAVNELASGHIRIVEPDESLYHEKIIPNEGLIGQTAAFEDGEDEGEPKE